MKFRTEIKVERSSLVLDPAKPILLVGSCFADNIGRRMRQCLWRAYNPFGTLYNPFSIERVLRTVVLDDIVSSATEETAIPDIVFPGTGYYVFLESLFESGGTTRSWLFDSKLSSEFREDVTYGFRRRREVAIDTLADARALFVTFGTSYVFSLADRGDYVVSNCHKQPSAMFVRRRLSVRDIVEKWMVLAKDLRKCFPRLDIVFTVSPVRHIKDGLAGNERSKAILLLAVEELCDRLDFCHYFPAYEIVNDDLRDYRFYASDLVHPSDEAVEYIWEIFKGTFLDESGEALLKEGAAIVKGLLHRSLPDATLVPSEKSVLRRKEWNNAVRERYDKLIARTGEMLPFNYPFASDPGWI